MFSNAIGSKNSKRKWTLNINSTGAKEAAWYYGYATNGGTASVVTSNGNATYTLFTNTNPLFVYNGTYYLSIGYLDNSYYYDYDDYGDDT